MWSYDPVKHLYTIEGTPIPSVTQVIKATGLIDDTYFTEDARDRGKAVHLACEYHDKDVLDESSVHEDIRPYLEAYKAFLSESRYKPVVIEASGVCQVYYFGGTVDRIGILNDCIALIDIKSGAIQSWAALQTAAYERLYLTGAFGDFPDLQNHKCELRRYSLQLKNNGRYSLLRQTSHEDWLDFAAARRLYRFYQN